MADQEWYVDGLRFSCTQCGNCCSGPPGYVWFDDEEAKEIAHFLNLDEAAFRRRCAHTVNGQWTLNEIIAPDGKSHDCIFLRRDPDGKALCGIYPVRPLQCRTWPFWPSNLKSPAHWQRAGQRCPGMTRGNRGQGQLHRIQQIRIVRDQMEMTEA